MRRYRQLRADGVSARHADGAFAGNNAAAELLGVPTKPYHQKAYVTCLDLGEAGAIFTLGWERKLKLVGAEAKKTKQQINTVWIYPPRPDVPQRWRRPIRSTSPTCRHLTPNGPRFSRRSAARPRPSAGVFNDESDDPQHSGDKHEPT